MNKKKTVLTIIVVFLFIIVFFLAYLLFNKYVLKKSFESNILPFAKKNEDTVFAINKITFFSNADSKNKSVSSSNFTIENLYQYTDIALFIKSPTNEKNLENTFKKVYINNIKFEKIPEVRKPKIIL